MILVSLSLNVLREGNQEVRDGQDGRMERPGGEGNRDVDILFLDSTG